MSRFLLIFIDQHDLSLDLPRLFIEREGVCRLTHGEDAVDHRTVGAQLARGEIVGGQLPFPARIRGGIAHPRAANMKLLTVELLPFGGCKMNLSVGCSNVTNRGALPPSSAEALLFF